MTIKRSFDLVVASFLLFFCSPLFVLIGCLIWLDSPGPIIFLQERIGKGKVPFIIFKFRTMVDGKHITRVGRMLRRSHLDELPQLINVIRGEMSLVGPRPLPTEEFAQIENLLPQYADCFVILPGMTGFAQIAGRTWIRNAGLFRRCELDRTYIRDQDLLLDIKILAKTLIVVCKLQGR
jgi:putative colanic acid biosynthesis UDP-glucose lipid carrier transferase